MEKMDTVLAALDLEAGSDVVLARAVQLATVHGAVLVVLHVIEAEPVSPAAAHMNLTQGELRAQLEQQAIAALEAKLIENHWTRQTEVHVAFGPPHEVITHAARERHADVVVIGPGEVEQASEADADAALTEALKRLPTGEAASEVARALGMNRKTLYRRALELQGK